MSELAKINEFKLSLLDKPINEKIEAKAKLAALIKYKQSIADRYGEEIGCEIWLEWDVGNWLKENVRQGGSELTRRQFEIPDGISQKESSRWQMIR